MASHDETTRCLTPRELAASEQLVLKRVLGRGGFSTVYKATWVRPGASKDQVVTVKVLLPKYNTHAGVHYQQFVREASFLHACSSPTIVKCHDLVLLPAGFPSLKDAYSGPALAMVLDFVPNGTLLNLLMTQLIEPHRRLYTVAQAFDILGDVAEGLAHLHTSHPAVIHRDVKPGNVLLDRSGGKAGAPQRPAYMSGDFPTGPDALAAGKARMSARISDFGLHVRLDGTRGQLLRRASQQHARSSGPNSAEDGSYRHLRHAASSPAPLPAADSSAAGLANSSRHSASTTGTASSTGVFYSAKYAHLLAAAGAVQTGGGGNRGAAGGAAAPPAVLELLRTSPRLQQRLQQGSASVGAGSSPARTNSSVGGGVTVAAAAPMLPRLSLGGGGQVVALEQGAARGKLSNGTLAVQPAATAQEQSGGDAAAPATAERAGTESNLEGQPQRLQQQPHQQQQQQPQPPPQRSSVNCSPIMDGGPSWNNVMQSQLSGVTAQTEEEDADDGWPQPQGSPSAAGCLSSSPVLDTPSNLEVERLTQELLAESADEFEWVFDLTEETGSLVYMAPEVHLRQPYNTKCDVYSFGVLMYEVLGRTLVSKTIIGDHGKVRTAKEYVRLIVTGWRPSKPDAVSPEAWALVDACWHADPNLRPNMADVVRRLRALQRQRQRTDGEGSRAAAERSPTCHSCVIC